MNAGSLRTAPIGIAVGAVIALTAIRLVTMMALFSIDGDAPIGSHPLHWLVMALNAAVCAGIIVGAIAVAKMSPADLGWSRFVPARDVPWALVALVVAAA